jgi:hypothetical protein
MKYRNLIAPAALVLAMAGCSSAKVGVNQTATTGAGSQTTASPSTTAPSSPKTATVSSLMTGTAHPTLPPLVPGKVAILVTAPPVNNAASTTVPVMVGNGTSGYISHVDVSGPAVDSTGKIVGSGDSQGFNPTNVAPGQVSFGFVFFSSIVPTGSTFQFKVTYDTGKSSTALDAQVTQANAGTDPQNPQVVGSVTNNTSVTIKSPISVGVYCFDSAGALIGQQGGFTDGNADLTQGAVASFSVGFYDTTCPTFLVGASGYSF